MSPGKMGHGSSGLADHHRAGCLLDATTEAGHSARRADGSPPPEPPAMITAAVYDTKPYDRQYLTAAAPADSGITWRFYDFRLRAETAMTAEGAEAVVVFVND